MIDDLWCKNGVFYCLSVGTYMDANGDGIGDLKGLLRRLDYLHGLALSAIWLMPFQPSPGKDAGYDIYDYYSADPRYGWSPTTYTPVIRHGDEIGMDENLDLPERNCARPRCSGRWSRRPRLRRAKGRARL
jgi:Alpha amylase, catalytic domain